MRHSQNLEPVVGHPASSDETVHRLSQNDPSIAGLILNVGDTSAKHSDWPEQVGRAISRSTHLRGLQINGGSTPCLFEDRWQSFFMCLFHNRSIEYLTVYFVNFRKIDIFHILAPFIERNANLRNMVVWSSKIRPMISIPSLVSAISHLEMCRLETINFQYCEIGDIMAHDFINALSAIPGLNKIVELLLGFNEIACFRCVALCTLFKNPECRIEDLDLTGNHLMHV